MAIYHLSVKIGGRAKGQSAIAASAYRSGEKLKDYETGLTSDYSRKQRIVCCGIALCENAPEEYADRETLWNAVHKIEKSKDARLWREIEVALPKELNQDEQIATVREFVNYLTQKGMCADWAIHDSGDGNPHAHIMLTTRSILPNGKWAGKSRKVYDLDENGQRIFQKIDKTGRKQYKCHKEDYNDWNDKERVEEWRAVWAECCNARLSEQDRIDHRSYARQGIDQIPTIHEGYAARQRVADGLPSDRVQLNDKIRQQNSLLEDIENQVNSIESEIQQLTAEFKSAQRGSLGKYISNLSLKKITKYKNNESYALYLVINESRNSQYRLEILDSPFEETQNDEKIKEESCNEINKFMSTLEFFNEYLNLSEENKTVGVDFTFFAGTLWRETDERTAILKRLNEHHVPCRIIINEGTEITNAVHRHMKNPNKSISLPIDNIKLWYEQQKKFIRNLQIKICPLPLLRNYYHIKNENNPQDALRISHYIYGNGDIEKNCIQILLKDSPKWEFFSSEFEYLWAVSM